MGYEKLMYIPVMISISRVNMNINRNIKKSVSRNAIVIFIL